MINRYVRWLEKEKMYAGIELNNKKLFKNIIILSICLAFFSFFINPFLALFLLILPFIILNFLLFVLVEKNKNFVENILPDVLDLVSANLRSGMIPSKAIVSAVRPEFGRLGESILEAGKEMDTGRSVYDSLDVIKKSANSELLWRTIDLIKEGIKSGGSMASLLEETANNIRRISSIQKEVRANILMYAIFIVFASCIGAPILYALSIFLISTITSIGSKIVLPEDITSRFSFIKIGGVQTIDENFLLAFSLISISITSISSSILLGIINSGKASNGIKYMPIFMIIALVVFFFSKMFITNIFSGFML